MVFSLDILVMRGGLEAKPADSIDRADIIAGMAPFPGGERPVRWRFLRNSHAPALPATFQCSTRFLP
jgi:hypothetical protein